MSQAILEFTANSREIVGKGASRRLRREQGLIPAIVYGTGKPAVKLTISHNEMFKAVQHEVFFSSILTLHVDGKSQKVILKDLQRHPAKPIILHADFLRISEKSAITMTVPLHFIGGDEAPGVKTEGGVVMHAANDVEIKCLPSDLPEFIQVDISGLALGDSIHLSGIILPKDVELATPIEDDAHDHMVVSVQTPRVEVEPEPEEVEAEGEEGAAEGGAEAAGGEEAAGSDEEKSE